MSEQNLVHDEEPRVVIRDKRRLDPTSGEVRPAADLPGPSEGGSTPEPAEGSAAAGDRSAELLADLQRVKAEFDNYRKRVERDRLAVVEQAAARVVAELLPVLDDVELARQHGEVDGGFKAVTDSLISTLSRMGLERFGEVGEPFDPTRHEAVLHSQSPDVDGPTCVEVMRPGYTFAGRLLRPAVVAVADAADEPAGPAAGE
ncbi:MAG TPA: nucleotide exchange factor GrpE [Mycobacteriales bacterium]|nr:nucleotide exchange factor GrpE [Mycobacteriales bacterium]